MTLWNEYTLGKHLGGQPTTKPKSYLPTLLDADGRRVCILDDVAGMVMGYQ